jgi:hypothetical protein
VQVNARSALRYFTSNDDVTIMILGVINPIAGAGTCTVVYHNNTKKGEVCFHRCLLGTRTT